MEPATTDPTSSSSELIAVHAAVPVEKLRQMIYAYPTFHRAVQDALANL